MDYNRYITHVIRVGDSLQKIAIAYGVDDWRYLVYVNNLVYPYICDTLDDNINEKIEGVLRVGDKLLIPSKEYNSPANNIKIDNIEKRAYGCDLDLYNYEFSGNERVKNLESKGELSNNNGDLKLSEGIENLRQRLLIRLSVAKGSMILHPEFGSDIDKYVGLKGTQQNIIKLQLAVQESILSDNLVEKVKDLTVEVKGGVLTINCEIIPTPPHSPFKFTEDINTSMMRGV